MGPCWAVPCPRGMRGPGGRPVAKSEARTAPVFLCPSCRWNGEPSQAFGQAPLLLETNFNIRGSALQDEPGATDEDLEHERPVSANRPGACGRRGLRPLSPPQN